MGADTNIQFSEPQLEQIRCAEEETAKARLVSQSAHKTTRFSSSLARLMSLRLIFEPISNLSHVVRLIFFSLNLLGPLKMESGSATIAVMKE